MKTTEHGPPKPDRHETPPTDVGSDFLHFMMTGFPLRKKSLNPVTLMSEIYTCQGSSATLKYKGLAILPRAECIDYVNADGKKGADMMVQKGYACLHLQATSKMVTSPFLHGFSSFEGQHGENSSDIPGLKAMPTNMTRVHHCLGTGCYLLQEASMPS
ncbi:hypothetical protein llap_6948 [Limosa lapponica baueri]|uniref:Uncharacterized protein n=1 Tax=Limosa lapponica baueri TaxID=1758121 RepID=A0A2I0U9L4_LIMLA|nr:hypothetical protein llap_6948 [Limosa lapponica baueri]